MHCSWKIFGALERNSAQSYSVTELGETAFLSYRKFCLFTFVFLLKQGGNLTFVFFFSGVAYSEKNNHIRNSKKTFISILKWNIWHYCHQSVGVFTKINLQAFFQSIHSSNFLMMMHDPLRSSFGQLQKPYICNFPWDQDLQIELIP